LEDLGVDEKIILEGVFRKGRKEKTGLYLTQNRDQWRVLVKTVMNLGVP